MSAGNILADSGQFETGDGKATLEVYGSSLSAGFNALYVEGGTTLSGAGLIHGVSIGAQTIAGVNLNRIDVLPTNILITSSTYAMLKSLM